MYTIAVLSTFSCTGNTTRTLTAYVAGSNIDSLQQVANQFPSNTLEYKAVNWILDNMTYHYTLNSPALTAFKEKVMHSESEISKRQLNDWWREVSKDNNYEVVYDAKTISPSFLYDDIEKAVCIWQQSAWKQDVPFETFCRYVLPYRVDDEQLEPGTRDSLYKIYSPVIDGVTDMKVAFALVHKMLKTKIHTANLVYDYNPSALMMEKMRMGSCLQRCIHEVTVMRSLGIPATIDYVPHWANYSTQGHSWVSLITADGTYCMPEQDSYDGPEDSIPRKLTYLDSSVFHVRQDLEEGYPYSPNFKKRHSVINRKVFEYQQKDYCDNNASDNIQKFFLDPFQMDVSAEYGCKSSFVLETDIDASCVYLCTYFTSRGWTPIAYANKVNGQFQFSHIGDSILCLVMVAKEHEMLPIGSPFLLFENSYHYLHPNTAVTDSIVLYRKYPLIGRFFNNWTELIGGIFEGSNDSLFASKETLAQITSTPVFRNVLPLKGAKYRYVRYHSPEGIKSPLTEIEIYSGDVLQKGRPFGKGVNLPERCFDGDTFSMLDKTHSGYTVGLDLGHSVMIDKLVFYPRNDGNFVLPGHEYELLYFGETGWESLGRTTADGYSLSYTNVPQNALLLLSDLGGGKEERPFILRNGIIEWW